MIEFFPNFANPPTAGADSRSAMPEPVPAILTEDEAIRFLRLDVEGGVGGRDIECARRALRRLVETKRIRPARVGRFNRYAREELRRFLLHATELVGEAPIPRLLGTEGVGRP